MLKDFIKDLGRKIQAQSRERRSWEFKLRRLSIAVQRGNRFCHGRVGCMMLILFFYSISHHFGLIHLFNNSISSPLLTQFLFFSVLINNEPVCWLPSNNFNSTSGQNHYTHRYYTP